jgi:hypothetical protein
VTLALLSGIFVARAPELVRVDDGAGALATTSPLRQSPPAAAASPAAPAPARTGKVRAWAAGFSAQSEGQMARRAVLAPVRVSERRARTRKPIQVQAKHSQQSPQVLAAYRAPDTRMEKAPAAPEGQFVLVVETRQTITATNNGWQVSVQQLRWLVPVSRTQKPVPGKI